MINVKPRKRWISSICMLANCAAIAAQSPALLPMPREIALTGGECDGAMAPKFERTAVVPPEGYELSVTADGVTIRASDDAGEFYARQTLRQLKDGATLPCCEIKDSPRFRWRGVHIDDVRHFMGKETVMRVIDEMARYKFNVLHWHLTDDQSWRIDVPGYPELLSYGDQCLVDDGQQRLPSTPRKGRRFYTADDIRDVVRHAAERHVRIVPEIEFPGHFYSVLCAYPEFACDPEAVLKQGRCPMVKGIRREVMCVGNPDAVKFVEAALDAVCDLFPASDVIHIGGDECPRKAWEKCPKCRALMAREGLADVGDIQAWLTRHVAAYLAARGRRAIGWHEMLDVAPGSLPAATMGMMWRPKGLAVTLRAVEAGHEIVNCNNHCCYLDWPQGIEGDDHRYLPRRPTTLEVAYSFDPLAGFPEEARGKIVGGQCCNWAEFTFTREDLEWKLWPRALAIAEVLWTYPDPAKRSLADFTCRAAVCRDDMAARALNPAPVK